MQDTQFICLQKFYQTKPIFCIDVPQGHPLYFRISIYASHPINEDKINFINEDSF